MLLSRKRTVDLLGWQKPVTGLFVSCDDPGSRSGTSVFAQKIDVVVTEVTRSVTFRLFFEVNKEKH